LDFNELVSLVVIRRSAEEEADVDELLNAMRDEVRRSREAGNRTNPLSSTDFNEGITMYLAGDHEAGLELIGKAVQDGYFVVVNNPLYQALYDDPGYAPIREAQQARQARERARFLDVVCGENPYADVWQPLEETCQELIALAPE
jgi:hypothetical protein